MSNQLRIGEVRYPHQFSGYYDPVYGTPITFGDLDNYEKYFITTAELDKTLAQGRLPEPFSILKRDTDIMSDSELPESFTVPDPGVGKIFKRSGHSAKAAAVKTGAEVVEEESTKESARDGFRSGLSANLQPSTTSATLKIVITSPTVTEVSALSSDNAGPQGEGGESTARDGYELRPKNPKLVKQGPDGRWYQEQVTFSESGRPIYWNDHRNLAQATGVDPDDFCLHTLMTAGMISPGMSVHRVIQRLTLTKKELPKLSRAFREAKSTIEKLEFKLEVANKEKETAEAKHCEALQERAELIHMIRENRKQGEVLVWKKKEVFARPLAPRSGPVPVKGKPSYYRTADGGWIKDEEGLDENGRPSAKVLKYAVDPYKPEPISGDEAEYEMQSIHTSRSASQQEEPNKSAAVLLRKFMAFVSSLPVASESSSKKKGKGKGKAKATAKPAKPQLSREQKNEWKDLLESFADFNVTVPTEAETDPTVFLREPHGLIAVVNALNAITLKDEPESTPEEKDESDSNQEDITEAFPKFDNDTAKQLMENPPPPFLIPIADKPDVKVPDWAIVYKQETYIPLNRDGDDVIGYYVNIYDVQKDGSNVYKWSDMHWLRLRVIRPLVPVGPATPINSRAATPTDLTWKPNPMLPASMLPPSMRPRPSFVPSGVGSHSRSGSGDLTRPITIPAVGAIIDDAIADVPCLRKPCQFIDGGLLSGCYFQQEEEFEYAGQKWVRETFICPAEDLN